MLAIRNKNCDVTLMFFHQMLCL